MSAKAGKQAHYGTDTYISCNVGKVQKKTPVRDHSVCKLGLYLCMKRKEVLQLKSNQHELLRLAQCEVGNHGILAFTNERNEDFLKVGSRIVPPPGITRSALLRKMVRFQKAWIIVHSVHLSHAVVIPRVEADFCVLVTAEDADDIGDGADDDEDVGAVSDDAEAAEVGVVTLTGDAALLVELLSDDAETGEVAEDDETVGAAVEGVEAVEVGEVTLTLPVELLSDDVDAGEVVECASEAVEGPVDVEVPHDGHVAAVEAKVESGVDDETDVAASVEAVEALVAIEDVCKDDDCASVVDVALELDAGDVLGDAVVVSSSDDFAHSTSERAVSFLFVASHVALDRLQRSPLLLDSWLFVSPMQKECTMRNINKFRFHFSSFLKKFPCH